MVVKLITRYLLFHDVTRRLMVFSNEYKHRLWLADPWRLFRKTISKRRQLTAN